MESKKRGREEQPDETGGDKKLRKDRPEQRFLLEPEKTSYLIGKGGAVIKSLIQNTGASLKFFPLREGTTLQIGSLSGSPDGLFTAFDRIVDRLGKYRSTDGKPPHLVLLVPSTQIGLIVGKGGQIVRTIQAQTGARIKISARPETASTDGAPVDQEVTVEGTAISISGAVRSLVGSLFSQSLSATLGSGGAPPPLPPGGPGGGFWPQPTPTGPSGPHAPPPLLPNELEIRFVLRSPEVSRIIGKGGQGIRGLCKQAHVKLFFDRQSQPGANGAGPSQIGMIRGLAANVAKAAELLMTSILSSPAVAEESSEAKTHGTRFLLLVPSSVVGFLLGPKGSRLKETKTQTNANISITGRSEAYVHASGGPLQTVVIEGDGEQVTAGLKALIAQLEEARVPRQRLQREEEQTAGQYV